MKRIFISYRRTDSITITGRMYDRLVIAFGEENVFKDVDDIPLGQDFRQTLENEVSRCDILCVVIGKEWVNVKDATGQRRLDDPNDFVRIEVAAGLRRPGVLVVPCLVNGARMPSADELPSELVDLCFRNAAVVRDDPDFSRDMNRLIEQIKKVNLPKPPAALRSPRATSGFVSKWLVGGVVALLLLSVAAIVFFAFSSVLLSQVEVTASLQPRVLATARPPTNTPVPTPTPEPTSTPLPLEQAATARDNARVWSAPDVKTAQVVTTITSGTAVILVGDAVQGPIRLDTDDQGDWYQVRLLEESELLGWIWIDRVIITER